MTDKNIFVYKPFLSLDISDFSFLVYFLCKNCTTTPPPMKKATPIFPSNHPLRYWNLRTEILSSPSFLKMWWKAKPLSKKRGGVQHWNLFELKSTITYDHHYLKVERHVAKQTLLDKWSRKDCIVTFTFTSHKCQKWRHQHLGTFHIFIFHIRCV